MSESAVSERRSDAIHQIAIFSNRSWSLPSTLRLSRREVQILRMLADGYSNKGIADQVFVSKDTVKYHLKNLYGKLGVRNRFEALVMAANNGLLEEVGSVE